MHVTGLVSLLSCIRQTRRFHSNDMVWSVQIYNYHFIKLQFSLEVKQCLFHFNGNIFQSGWHPSLFLLLLNDAIGSWSSKSKQWKENKVYGDLENMETQWYIVTNMLSSSSFVNLILDLPGNPIFMKMTNFNNIL